MRLWRSLCCLALTLMILFVGTSCNAVETERGRKIQGQCEQVIDAMLDKNVNTAYALFTAETDKTAFTGQFPVLCTYLEEVETYQLKQIGWYVSRKNGRSYYQATFEMKTNAGLFRIIGTEVDGLNGLYDFQLQLESQFNPKFTGTITTMAGANAFQWVLFVLSLVMFLFVVITAVDCSRRKMKYKPLWLILTLAAMVTFTLTLSDGNLSAHFGVGILFPYNYLALYETGAFAFRLMVPIGAIIYWLVRRPMTKTEPPAQTV